jgi:hypothetical protein
MNGKITIETMMKESLLEATYNIHQMGINAAKQEAEGKPFKQ